MATKPNGWPTHGNAVADRDEVAETAAEIEAQVAEFVKLIEQGKGSRDLSLLLAYHVQSRAQKILRLMERNGAQTRPR